MMLAEERTENWVCNTTWKSGVEHQEACLPGTEGYLCVCICLGIVGLRGSLNATGLDDGPGVVANGQLRNGRTRAGEGIKCNPVRASAQLSEKRDGRRRHDAS